MDHDSILETARYINENRSLVPKEELAKRHPLFATQYSALFDMCLLETMNFSILRQCIEFLKKRETGELSEYDSNYGFGQVLVDEIVLPKKKE
jgi:hypothetical protein